MNRYKERIAYRRGQLIAKLLMFAVALLWLFVYLYMCIVFFDFFQDIVEGYAQLSVQWAKSGLDIWYLITCIYFGIAVATKAFRLVGTWEKADEEEVYYSSHLPSHFDNLDVS